MRIKRQVASAAYDVKVAKKTLIFLHLMVPSAGFYGAYGKRGDVHSYAAAPRHD